MPDIVYIFNRYFRHTIAISSSFSQKLRFSVKNKPFYLFSDKISMFFTPFYSLYPSRLLSLPAIHSKTPLFSSLPRLFLPAILFSAQSENTILSFHPVSRLIFLIFSPFHPKKSSHDPS